MPLPSPPVTDKVSPFSATSLDPLDWPAARADAHALLDDVLSHMQTLTNRPLWQAPPETARDRLMAHLSPHPTALAELGATIMRDLAPYSSGNAHPGFMGWVQGGGTLAGVLGELWAAGLNANLGGRHHMAVELEKAMGCWMARLFGFPDTAHGLFLTGASQANFISLLIARHRVLPNDRAEGLGPDAARLRAYGSDQMHGCLPRAFEMAGLGRNGLKTLPSDAGYCIDIAALKAALRADRAAGLRPFMLIGTAGTVNTGAIDDLEALADLAATEGLHFHVDGALGAPGVMSAAIRPQLAGIDRADSLAFDFHKWLQTPYDAGYVLIRDQAWMRDAFAQDNAYLSRADSGLAAGDRWPCDHGPDLSRGFRALKAWMTLAAYGTDALGEVMAKSCRLAQNLAARLKTDSDFELKAAVSLNIVCFSVRHEVPAESDRLNRALIEALYQGGQVAPSLTLLKGRAVLRAAFVNHRTSEANLDHLMKALHLALETLRI